MIKCAIFIFCNLIIYSLSGQVNISARIINLPDSSEIKLYHFNNPFEIIKIEDGHTYSKNNGQFNFTFSIVEAQPYRLIIAEKVYTLFLEKNSELSISGNYNNLDSSLHYEGIGSIENNYLAAENMANYQMKAIRHRPFRNETQFTIFIDSLELENQKLLKSFNQNFSQEFQNYILPRIKYLFFYSRRLFKVSYAPSTTNAIAEDKVKDNYFDFLRSMNLNEQAYAKSTTYEDAIKEYFYEFYDTKFDRTIYSSEDKIRNKELAVLNKYAIRKSLLKGKVLDYQLTDLMKMTLTYARLNQKLLDSLMSDYISICKDTAYHAIIYRFYYKATQLMPGKMAPNFRLVNQNGDSVSLTSFKGKFVYIDFWATSCAPCMDEMPYSSLLMDTFENRKDLVFLFVNVRDDYNKWKQFISKENKQGVHLFADVKQTQLLMREYNFNGIPRYILIDKEGRIINTNAERPSKVMPILQKALAN